MLAAHAATLAQARSYLAALADKATSFDASVDFERVLLHLDYLHGDDIPAITPVPPHTIDVLYDVAYDAIEELTTHGVDLLSVELLLDGLELAWMKELP